MTQQRKNPDKYKNLLEALRNHEDYLIEAPISDFIEEFLALMEKEGVSRRELAERLGTSQAYVSKILNGNANFTLSSMTKLAHALGKLVRIHLAEQGTVTVWRDLAGSTFSTTADHPGNVVYFDFSNDALEKTDGDSTQIDNLSVTPDDGYDGKYSMR